MPEDIRICVDRLLPAEKLVDAAERAIEENPANAPIAMSRRGLGLAPRSPLRIAVETSKRWKPGRTLRVRFLGGIAQVQAKVQGFANQWSQFTNITFAFGADPNAEIRIAFTPGDGSWSYIGTDALGISLGEPTMNFGWLTPTTSDDEYSRVVLHEFGHALGCIHEHQHPQANIPWNKEAVYRYFGGPPNNWSRQDVDRNIFERYSVEETNFSAFDPASIMLYAIPKELTDGVFEVGWNTKLSATDREFMGSIYPFAPAAVTSLTVGAPAVAANIGKHGEEDLYRFAADTQARYVVETSGPTDVVMGLFGPDSETTLVAEDDDSGRGFNAKIDRILRPGTYVVRMRHYQPTGTGQYSIAVRRR
jgi:hypothetical protein